MLGFLSLIPLTHRDGDVIVAAGNIQRKEVVAMSNDLYTNIGYIFIWCVKYIFIPLGVAITARCVTDK